MTDQEKIEVLRKCFEDTIWMAIRYAHGRMTYAPGMVRDAVTEFKKVYPEWKPKQDITIEPRKADLPSPAWSSDGDYLDDLFK